MTLLLVIMTMSIALIVLDELFAFQKVLYLFKKTLRKNLLATNKRTIEFRSYDDEITVNQQLDTQSSDEWKDYTSRFGNVARLYDGDISLKRLYNSHVCVIGLGGVGSWVCEGLVRSGVHSLTLIDFDDICVSNINRQIHAMSSTVGEFKADALKARLLDINPYAKIHVLHEFIRKDNIYDILNSPLSYAASVNSIDNDLAHDSDSNSDDANFIQKREYKYEQCKTFYDLYDTSLNNNNSLVEVPPPATRFDCIIDAADGVSDKAAIVHYCVQTSTMCVLSGGAGGLVDPTLIRVSDLSRAIGDNLIMRVRKKLRQDYGYPAGENVITDNNTGQIVANSKASKKGKSVKLGKTWGVPVVHTLPTGIKRTLKAALKKPTTKDIADATRMDSSISCSDNPTILTVADDNFSSTDTAPVASSTSFRQCDLNFGNAAFVTGTLGLIMSGVVVSAIATNNMIIPRKSSLLKHLKVRNNSVNVTESASSLPTSESAAAAAATLVARSAWTESTAEEGHQPYDCCCGGGFNESRLVAWCQELPLSQSAASSTSYSSFLSAAADASTGSSSSNDHIDAIPPYTSTVAQQQRQQCEQLQNEYLLDCSVALIDAHCHLQLKSRDESPKPLSPLPPSPAPTAAAGTSSSSESMEWDRNVSAIVSTAKKAGLRHVVVCGVQPGSDWEAVRQLALNYPTFVIPQYGLHPWRIVSYFKSGNNNDNNNNNSSGNDSNSSGSGSGSDSSRVSGGLTGLKTLSTGELSLSDDWRVELEGLLQLDPQAGVGECGLDKSIKQHVALDTQAEIVRQHFEIAIKHQRSITLHCVGAWGRLLSLVQEFHHDASFDANTTMFSTSSSSSSSSIPCVGMDTSPCLTDTVRVLSAPVYTKSVVLHACNSMPIEFVSMFLKYPSIYFSFTVRSTSLSTKEATLLKAIPLSKLLLETDSPDQLPKNLQSVFSSNQCGLLAHGCEAIAKQCLQVDYAQLADATYLNTMHAFGIKSIDKKTNLS